MRPELDDIIACWDKASAKFDQKPGHGVRSEAEKRAWIDLFVRVLGSPGRILDVGTGTGEMAMLLAALGHRVVGIDVSERMLERAKEKARRLSLPVDFRFGDAENLPFDNASFDALVCRHLLWQLHNPEQALREWLRVLRPGGIVLSIEGQWRPGGSPREKLRDFIANIFLFVLEGRTRWGSLDHGRKNTRARLFWGRVGPEEAAEFFRNVGLVNVAIDGLQGVREAEQEHMTWMERVAYPFSRYMIVGCKKSGG